jgi:CRP-like cAMP-binding protein
MILDLVLSLKKVKVFSQIPDNLLVEIAEIIEVEEISKGQQFISKENVGDCMYIIKEGRVRVHHGDVELAILSEHEIVGELALLAPVKRTADVTALDDLILFKIHRDYFMDMLLQESEIVKGILKVLVDRIVYQNELISSQKAPA